MQQRYRISVKLGFSLAACTALAVSAATSQDPAAWDAKSGTWRVTGNSGTGSRRGDDWGEWVSRAWYGDFDFSGSITIPADANRGCQTAILLRYAGRSECYKLVLDGANRRVRLVENHYGKSIELDSVNTDLLVRGTPVRFRATGRGPRLSVVLGSDRVTLSHSNVRIPGGRVGLAVRGGTLHFSELTAAGTAASDYVFHYNYAMRPSTRNEPMWKFLNDCGSELPTRYPTFTTKSEFESYREHVILGMRRSLGLDPWPERSPLNPQITGKLDRGSFTIEKILFESQPGFKVNALLYVPKNVAFPVPAVLSPAGHWWDGVFYPEAEQGRHIGLAKNGYVVLVYDPVGQGERSWLGGHNPLRQQIGLAGMDASGLMFWDSIRAIDYLCGRPEVDATKIGVTGVSGGGFNTLHTALLDPRVKVCAPNGYATTTEALVKRATYGCCGHTPNMCLFGDHSELYACLAPTPTLILGGYTDVIADRVLPIYERARQSYRLYGAQDALRYYLDPDAGHTYSFPERVEMIHFFNRYLKGIHDPQAAVKANAEAELLPRSRGLLTVFPDGESKGIPVIDLVRDFLARNRVRYPSLARPADVAAFQHTIKPQLTSLMGDMAVAAAPRVVRDDAVTRPGSVRHVLLKTERDIPVPVQIHHPPADAAVRGLVIYFQMAVSYPNGSLPKREMIETLLSEGLVVVDPQVRGSGSTSPSGQPTVQLLSMALGKHLFSTRIFDLFRVVDFLKMEAAYRALSITLWGEGMREAMMALYAAALDVRLDRVVATHGLISYQDVIDRDAAPSFDWYVPGILRVADTAQLVGAIAPRRVIVDAPVYATNSPASGAEIAEHYAWAERVYEATGNASEFVCGSQVDPVAALLDLPTATVRGTFTAGGCPAVGARVEVVGTGASTTTDAGGRYALIVRAGTVTLRASGRGYAPQRARMTVTGGTQRTRDFDLQTVVREWSLARDFSQRDNPHGAWSFGYRDAVRGVFQPYGEFKWAGAYPGQFGFWKPPGNGAHDRWGSVDVHVGPDGSRLYGLQCYDHNQVSLHAGRGTAADGSDRVATTARWTSPLDGRVRVSAVFAGVSYARTGSHARVGVSVNGASTFAATLDGFAGGGGLEPIGLHPTRSYLGVLPVSVGDRVDFTAWFNGEYLVEGYVGCAATIKEVVVPPAAKRRRP